MPDHFVLNFLFTLIWSWGLFGLRGKLRNEEWGLGIVYVGWLVVRVGVGMLLFVIYDDN